MDVTLSESESVERGAGSVGIGVEPDHVSRKIVALFDDSASLLVREIATTQRNRKNSLTERRL
jgi:hypothetical protein